MDKCFSQGISAKWLQATLSKTATLVTEFIFYANNRYDKRSFTSECASVNLIQSFIITDFLD